MGKSELVESVIDDHPDKFKLDQQLYVHKAGSIFWTPKGSIDLYTDDEDSSYEIRGKRVIGIKLKHAKPGQDNLLRFAPGMRCNFGQIVWVGLHRRKKAWSAVAVVRNGKGLLLPLLKLLWFDNLRGTPWTDLEVMREHPEDVDDLLKRSAVLIKTADMQKLASKRTVAATEIGDLEDGEATEDDEEVSLADAKEKRTKKASGSSSSRPRCRRAPGTR